MDERSDETAPRGRPADTDTPSKEPGVDGDAPEARGGTTPRVRRPLIALAVLLLLVAAAGFGWRWWTHWSFFQSTNDAYLQADMVTISPRVSGYVAELRVTDNQRVERGEVLVRIDDREYRAALDQARANVAGGEADVQTIDAQSAQQQATIEQVQTRVASAEASLRFAEQEDRRYQDLARRGFGTEQRAQQTSANLREGRASLNGATSSLIVARQQVAILRGNKAQAAARLLRFRAALAQAQLNLDWATVVSPADGVVGDRTAQRGQLVQSGTGLMDVVPVGRDVYLVANYKETQLERMAPGQTVELDVDTFPGHTFKGTVNSLSPGTGSTFALLPPENATGNFTKIVQRVPVKILLDPSDPMVERLRPGLSVIVTVDTRAVPAEAGAAGAMR